MKIGSKCSALLLEQEEYSALAEGGGSNIADDYHPVFFAATPRGTPNFAAKLGDPDLLYAPAGSGRRGILQTADDKPPTYLIRNRLTTFKQFMALRILPVAVQQC
jgi:hypothetical protein